MSTFIINVCYFFILNAFINVYYSLDVLHIQVATYY